MEAPHLPSGDADLADWSVYADYLQTKGDPHGELIAQDLALPAEAERDAVQAFHALAAPLSKVPRNASVTWCLGHVRSIELPGIRGVLDRFEATPEGTLASVTTLLADRRLSRLETIAVVYRPHAHPGAWRRLFRALPASCGRVDVTPTGAWNSAGADELISLLPPTVRELGIVNDAYSLDSYVARFVTDRFAFVDFTRAWLAPDARDAVGAAHRATRTLRCAGVAAIAFDPDRYRFGHPGDAGVLVANRVVRVPEWTLAKLQNRFGVIGVRAQLARSLPEGHAFDAERGTLATRRTWGGTHLVRRGSRWTLRPDAGTQFWICERELTGIEELRDGDAFAVRQQPSMDHPGSERIECVFVARDLDAMLRSRDAGRPG